MKSVLDPSFKYTPAVATDVRKTFERARRVEARQRLKQYREQIRKLRDMPDEIGPRSES